MKLRATILITLSVLLTGCGYHTAGSATHIPTNVRTLSVPIFATRVQSYRTEVAFTQAVIRELNTRTKYRVINKDDAEADATLSGTILTQTVTPLTYDATSGQSSSYLVSVTAGVLLTAQDGRVLYRNDAVTFREQYQSTQDLSGFIQEDSPAVNRMSRDFAKAVVSDMLESF
ncbi:MAG: LPS assembly lipoprotein LptE [Edaphobacter sp.]|uniref:LPS assembly lipoprotein LptE n=1 Tax=Edaphobacter sp. TaxID=1934404 RepID=UPI0023A45D86|nr:LPS assembly lipoprotein LptE [Edaphobacter sp.]MDE1177185.1 LPS assembly lipoprotein LptE [Edaphobacter sp.]